MGNVFTVKEGSSCNVINVAFEEWGLIKDDTKVTDVWKQKQRSR